MMKADMVEKIVEKLEQNLNNSIHFRRMLLQKKLCKTILNTTLLCITFIVMPLKTFMIIKPHIFKSKFLYSQEDDIIILIG